MLERKGPPEYSDQALNLASAIVRLHYLRQVGIPGRTSLSGKDFIEMTFRATGPLCKCCGKPMDRQNWLRSVIGPYGREILKLLAAEEPERPVNES